MAWGRLFAFWPLALIGIIAVLFLQPFSLFQSGTNIPQTTGTHQISVTTTLDGPTKAKIFLWYGGYGTGTVALSIQNFNTGQWETLITDTQNNNCVSYGMTIQGGCALEENPPNGNPVTSNGVLLLDNLNSNYFQNSALRFKIDYALTSGVTIGKDEVNMVIGDIAFIKGTTTQYVINSPTTTDIIVSSPIEKTITLSSATAPSNGGGSGGSSDSIQIKLGVGGGTGLVTLINKDSSGSTIVPQTPVNLPNIVQNFASKIRSFFSNLFGGSR